MAVEEAADVREGDWIRIDWDGRQVECEVSDTFNLPSLSVIGVTLADQYRRLQFLPDDSVLVTFYEEGYADG